VPRRPLPGAALLDQDVIVVEADLRVAISSAASRGNRRMPGQLLDLRDLAPPAEVLGERPGSPGGTGHQRQRPGAASTMSIARAALASSPVFRTPRTQATPSRANAAALDPLSVHASR